MNNKGVALIITFILMVSLTIMVAAYLFMVTYDTRHAGSQLSNDKALYLADAGLNKAIWYLTSPDSPFDSPWTTTDYPAEAGPDPTDPQEESLGDGTYTIWVKSLGGDDFLVTSRGVVNGISRTVQQTVTLASGVIEAFNKVQCSGGTIDFKNSSGNITGDIDAAGTVENAGGMTITGTITEGPLSVAVPSVNMASYADIADMTISGNRTINAGTYSGIWYVDGKVTIEDNVTFNGTIVATGNIVVGNADNFVVAPDPEFNYPALVTASDITGSNMKDAEITGLIFAAGSISLGNGSNNTINGSMISAGNMDIKGGSGWSITYNPDLSSNPPLYFSVESTSGSGWKEI